MTLSNFTEQLKTIRQHDLRHTYMEMFYTFELDTFYSPSMVHLIMTGKRDSRNSEFMNFLSRCVTVYNNNTKDYSHISEEQMNSELKKLEDERDIYISTELLARQISYTTTGIASALRGKGIFVPDVWDTLNLGLIPHSNNSDSIFENIHAYNKIVRKLMRAEISDGTKILTPYDLADLTGIDPSVLENIDLVCHDAKRYIDTYDKLSEITKPYEDFK